MILLLQMSFQEFLQVLLHFRMMFQDQMSRLTEVQDLVHLGIHRVSVFILVLDEYQLPVLHWSLRSSSGKSKAGWESKRLRSRLSGNSPIKRKNSLECWQRT